MNCAGASPCGMRTPYADGFFGFRGGYAQSGRIVALLANKAQRLGVAIYTPQTASELVRAGGRIVAVRTREGETFSAGHTLVAAGAWTHHLLPELQRIMVATGHPVFHLKPAKPELFAPPNFVTFTADVAATGWYGFPLLREGVVKIANHGVGVQLHADTTSVWSMSAMLLTCAACSPIPSLPCWMLTSSTRGAASTAIRPMATSGLIATHSELADRCGGRQRPRLQVCARAGAADRRRDRGYIKRLGAQVSVAYAGTAHDFGRSRQVPDIVMKM